MLTLPADQNRVDVNAFGMASLGVLTAAIAVGIIGNSFAIPLIVQHFGVSVAQAGLAPTLEHGGLALTCLLYAPYVPRFDARRVCLIALVGLVILNLATIFAPNFETLLVCRALAGLVAGTVYVTTSSVAGRTTAPEKCFATLLCSTGSLGILSSLVLPQAKNIGPLIGISPLASIYALYIPVLLIGFLFCLKMPRPPILSARNAETGARELTPLRELPLSTWGLLFGMSFMAFGTGALGTYLVSLGTEQVGLAVEKVGLVMMPGAIIRVVLPFVGAYISLRFRAVPFAAVVLSADAVLGMLLSHTTTWLAFAILAPILTSSYSLFSPVLLGTMSRLDPSGRIAAIHSPFFLGASSLAALAGGAVSVKGDYSAIGYVVVFGMAMSALTLYRGLRTADQQRFGGATGAPVTATNAVLD